METMTERIGVLKILITRGEGPSNLCGKTKIFNTWEDARLYFLSINSTLPEEGTYDKFDFTVIFADGEEYTGRADVKRIEFPNNEQDLKKRVGDYVRFYTGFKQPAWMTEAQYEQTLKGVNRQEYINFVDKYDV